MAMVLAITGSCSEPKPVRPAPPPPRPVPVRPAPPVVRAPADWRDADQTPGTWTWGMEAGQSTARFGGNLLILRCDRAAGQISIMRGAVSAQGQVPVSITTVQGTRGLTGTATADGISLSIAAGDRLLDAMAFSRGRFLFDNAGSPPLYLPSWSEVSRVVEDCR